MFHERFAALFETSAQNGMVTIGDGFVPGPNCILLCHRTVSQSCNLRKDIPNPMGLLSSPLQFCESAFIVISLRCEEALQVVWIRFVQDALGLILHRALVFRQIVCAWVAF